MDKRPDSFAAGELRATNVVGIRNRNRVWPKERKPRVRVVRSDRCLCHFQQSLHVSSMSLNQLCCNRVLTSSVFSMVPPISAPSPTATAVNINEACVGLYHCLGWYASFMAG